MALCSYINGFLFGLFVGFIVFAGAGVRPEQPQRFYADQAAGRTPSPTLEYEVEEEDHGTIPVDQGDTFTEARAPSPTRDPVGVHYGGGTAPAAVFGFSDLQDAILLEWRAEALRLFRQNSKAVISGWAQAGNGLLNTFCMTQHRATAAHVQSNEELVRLVLAPVPNDIYGNSKRLGDACEAALYRAQPDTAVLWLGAYYLKSRGIPFNLENLLRLSWDFAHPQGRLVLSNEVRERLAIAS